MKALEFYSMSVAFAPENSEEMALAFANRSAVSYSLKHYEDCITDIDRALLGKYPEHLKYKLYERKGRSLICIGKNDIAEESYNEALNSVNHSKLSEGKINSFISGLKEELDKIKSESNYNNDIKQPSMSDISSLTKVDGENCDMYLPKLSCQENTRIFGASVAIKIEYCKEMGRHIVANTDIEPGDVLVIEHPYASVLLPTAYNLYCFNCLKRSHTLLPCVNCTKVLFCSEICRDQCIAHSHYIECSVIEHLIDLGCSKLELLAVRTLILASSNKLKSLKELIRDIQNRYEKTNDERQKGFEDDVYKSDNYSTVHWLAANTDLRTNADLFRRSCFACCILHCIEKLSNYFEMSTTNAIASDCTDTSDSNFKEYFENKCFAGSLLLKYLQIMPCNAHEVSEMCLMKQDTSHDCDNNGNDTVVTYDSKEIGGALYPLLSLINHSCDPNVVRHSHQGDTVVLTAIQKIEQGEQILDNYGYHHAVHPLQTRQDHLLSQYHFTCRCTACLEDWPLYNLLPDKEIIYKSLSLREHVEKSSEEFREILKSVFKGTYSNSCLNKLLKHLSLLQVAVKRPWKEYSECQEAIKQTLSMSANHYIYR